VYMLNEQYRMHPKISHFPRHIFYGGALLDGPNVRLPDYGNPLRALLCRAIPTISPLTILDLDSTEERGGTSLSNMSEAKLAVFMYEQLKIHSRGLSSTTKVAIITPYSQQCRLLRDLFADRLGPQFESMVEINTVDAFQGREANIVIFSAVRAAGSRGIGFLSDVRRMNVALTRAKHFLFVIARCASVIVNPYWSDLIDHARETHAVLRVPLIGIHPNISFGDITSWQLEKTSKSDVALAPSAFSTALSDNAQNSKIFNFGNNTILPPPPVDPRKKRKHLL
jgi:senataxin